MAGSCRRPRAPCLSSFVLLGWAVADAGQRPRPIVEQDQLLAYVDVFIGTGAHGHTFPGPSLPWGMIVATPWAHGPHEAIWDTQAGFNSDIEMQTFYGMAHSALSGAGSGEMGELRLLPRGSTDGDMITKPKWVTASPGFIDVGIGPAGATRPHIHIQSSTTTRGAVHSFSFEPGSRSVQLLLSASPNNFWGYGLWDFEFNTVSTTSLTGCALSRVNGFANALSYMCFKIVFSEPFLALGLPQDLPSDVTLQFPALGTASTVVAHVAVSRSSLENAEATYARELEGKSLDDVHTAARNVWGAALARLDAKFASDEQARIFYTGLYHMLLGPNLISDEDGSYRLDGPAQGSGPGEGRGAEVPVHKVDDLRRDAAAGMDVHGPPKGQRLQGQKRHRQGRLMQTVNERLPLRKAEAGTQIYGTFSSWDTYRALHPLLGLVYPEVSRDFAGSLIQFVELWGYNPPWELYHSPTDMMEGDDGTMILGTLARQGLVDGHAAYAAMNRSRHSRLHAQQTVSKTHFVGHGTKGSVSMVLEQAKADRCTARVAADLGLHADAAFFTERALLSSMYWDARQHVFAPITSVTSGRAQHETLSTLDKCLHGFTEGTPRQYSFGMDFDVEHMTSLHGGQHAIVKHLDYFFNEAPVPDGDPDMTGNLHGMSIGNEPSMHVPYLYSLLGESDKAGDIIERLIKHMFNTSPQGLPGNDDLGATSAWAVLSMLGLYPVDACSGEFVLGRPLLSSAEVAVAAGKTVQVEVNGQGEERKVIRITWNDKDIDMKRPVLSWSALSEGGRLAFWLAPRAAQSAPATESLAQALPGGVPPEVAAGGPATARRWLGPWPPALALLGAAALAAGLAAGRRREAGSHRGSTEHSSLSKPSGVSGDDQQSLLTDVA